MEQKLVLEEIPQDQGEKKLLDITIGNETLGWFGVVKDQNTIGRKDKEMVYFLYLNLKEQVSDAIKKEYSVNVSLFDHYPIDFTTDSRDLNYLLSKDPNLLDGLGLSKDFLNPKPMFPYVVKFIDGSVKLISSTHAFIADFTWELTEKYAEKGEDGWYPSPDSPGYHTVNIKLLVKNAKSFKLKTE